MIYVLSFQYLPSKSDGQTYVQTFTCPHELISFLHETYPHEIHHQNHVSQVTTLINNLGDKEFSRRLSSLAVLTIVNK